MSTFSIASAILSALNHLARITELCTKQGVFHREGGRHSRISGESNRCEGEETLEHCLVHCVAQMEERVRHARMWIQISRQRQKKFLMWNRDSSFADVLVSSKLTHGGVRGSNKAERVATSRSAFYQNLHKKGIPSLHLQNMSSASEPLSGFYNSDLDAESTQKDCRQAAQYSQHPSSHSSDASRPLVVPETIGDNNGGRHQRARRSSVLSDDEEGTSEDKAPSIGVDSNGVPHDILSMTLKCGPEVIDFKGAKGLVKRDAINAAINAGLSRRDYPVAVIWGPRGSGKTVAAHMYAEKWERRGGTCVILNGSSESSLQQSWKDAQQASFFLQPQDEATTNGIRYLCVVEDVTEVPSFMESFQRQRPWCAVLYTTSEATVALALAHASEAVADASVLTPDEAVAVFTAVFPEVAFPHTQTISFSCVKEASDASRTLHRSDGTEQPQTDPKQSVAQDTAQATYCKLSVDSTYEKHIATAIAACLLKYCGNGRADLVHRCATAYALTVISAPHKEAVFSVTRFASWVEAEWRWLAQLLMARQPHRVPYRQHPLPSQAQSTVESYAEGMYAVDDETFRHQTVEISKRIAVEDEAPHHHNKERQDRRVESSNELAAPKQNRPVIFDFMNRSASNKESSDVERPQIASAIVSGHSRQDWPVAAIWGPPGCGKSTAARMAASKWQGSTLTVDGSSEGSLQMTLLRHLPAELESQLRKDKATTAQIVRCVIHSLPPPLLLILEDADDMEFGRRIVQVLVDLNITACPPMIIVTTHQREVALDIARSEDAVANASKLTKEEATTLFRSVFDFGASETPLETLLDTYCANSAWLVYRCAIACRLSFAADAKTAGSDPSVDALDQWFNCQWSRVAQDGGVDRTARRVFDMMMALTEDLWPKEANLLETTFRIVSQLLQTATGLVDISRALLVRIVTSLGTVWAPPDGPSDVTDDDTSAAELVIRLGEHIGLVKRITNGSITLHRLDLEGAWMESEVLHQLATKIYIDWSRKTLDNERDQTELRLLRHLAPQPSGVALLDVQADSLRGQVLLRFSVAAEALKVLQRCVVTLRAHFGENHVEVGTTLNNIGNALSSLGKTNEALEHYKQALSIKKAHFGENHVDVAATLNNIGNALGGIGKTNEALEHYEQALSIKKAHFGENHFDVAVTLNNIGTALRGLGKTDEALEHFGQALSIRKAHFGENHFEVAGTLNNIGAALCDLGKTDEALAHYQQALSIMKAHLGENYVEMAKMLDNIGGALSDLGKTEEALAHYKQALSIKKAHFGENHVGVAGTLNNIGAALSDLGKNDEALAHLKQALSLKKAHFGENRVEIAGPLHNMGRALSGLGKTDDALAHCEQALSIVKTHLGESHVQVGKMQNNIAVVFVRHGTKHLIFRHCAVFAEAYRKCVSSNRGRVRMTQLLILALSEGPSCVSLNEFSCVLRLCARTLQCLRNDHSLGPSISGKLYTATSPLALPPHSVCLDVSEFVAVCPPGYCITLAFTAFYPFVPPYVQICAHHSNNGAPAASGTSTLPRMGYPHHPAVNKTYGLVDPVLINALWYDATLVLNPTATYDLRHAVRVVSALLRLLRVPIPDA